MYSEYEIEGWATIIVLFVTIATIVFVSIQTSVVFDEENNDLLNENSSISDLKNYYEKCEKESGVRTNCQNLIMRKITELSENAEISD